LSETDVAVAKVGGRSSELSGDITKARRPALAADQDSPGGDSGTALAEGSAWDL